ncbi:MAG: hypothetical protein ABI968_01855 [Acidobacteriota bacterium]
MRKLSLALGMLAIAGTAMAQLMTSEDGNTVAIFRTKDNAFTLNSAPDAGTPNLQYHGGPVITNAKAVAIFWGGEWGTQSLPSALASEINAFNANFGSTGEYNVITQYSGIQPASLSNTYWVETVNPPVNVTDTKLRNKVKKYLNTFTGGIADPSTVYSVYLPSTSYSSNGSSTSCGGTNLVYCAYHGHFTFNGVDVKYASIPYPSCSGCQWTGFSTAQNFEHFVCHETREAVTDPDLNAWYDKFGAEADDKCAWSPAPFIDAGFGYQWEWSNIAHACVKTQ